MEYTSFLSYLSELERTLENLTHLQSSKIDAVRAHDLDALNECMKQEQAVSLSLRGLEQKRDRLLQRLNLTGVSLRELPRRCPPGYQGETSAAVERLLKCYERLRSAQSASRTLLEKDLRAINETLKQKGVLSDLDEGYQSGQSGASTPPTGPRTDFRA